MYYLIVDTCVWIDLGRKLTEVREKISDLIGREKVRLIVPQLVIDEWNEHKQAKIVEPWKASIHGMIKNARTISQYLEQQEADDFKRILDGFREREDEIETLALEEIRAIEDLFNHPSTIILPVTEEVKLWAVDFALAKKSPFQSKNSMADALIMLGAVDYIKQQNISGCIFVSSNTTDFSSQSDKNQIHEDMEELFSEHAISFFSNIGLAVNEIEELVSIESIRRIDVALQFAAAQEALKRQRQIMENIRSALDLSVFESAAQEAAERYRQIAESFKPAIDLSALDAMQETARVATEWYREMTGGFRAAMDLSTLDAIQKAAEATAEQYRQMISSFRPAMDHSVWDAMRAAAETHRQMMESVKSALDLSALDAAAQMAAERHRQMMGAIESTRDLHRMIEGVAADGREPSQREPGGMTVQQEGTSFTVYVNYPTNTATIHSTTCRYYRNRVADKTDNGHWKKPFTSFGDAQRYASSEDRKRTRHCKVCLTDRQN